MLAALLGGLAAGGGSALGGIVGGLLGGNPTKIFDQVRETERRGIYEARDLMNKSLDEASALMNKYLDNINKETAGTIASGANAQSIFNDAMGITSPQTRLNVVQDVYAGKADWSALQNVMPGIDINKMKTNLKMNPVTSSVQTDAFDKNVSMTGKDISKTLNAALQNSSIKGIITGTAKYHPNEKERRAANDALVSAEGKYGLSRNAILAATEYLRKSGMSLEDASQLAKNDNTGFMKSVYDNFPSFTMYDYPSKSYKQIFEQPKSLYQFKDVTTTPTLEGNGITQADFQKQLSDYAAQNGMLDPFITPEQRFQSSINYQNLQTATNSANKTLSRQAAMSGLMGSGNFANALQKKGLELAHTATNDWLAGLQQNIQAGNQMVGTKLSMQQPTYQDLASLRVQRGSNNANARLMDAASRTNWLTAKAGVQSQGQGILGNFVSGFQKGSGM